MRQGESDFKTRYLRFPGQVSDVHDKKLAWPIWSLLQHMLSIKQDLMGADCTLLIEANPGLIFSLFAGILRDIDGSRYVWDDEVNSSDGQATLVSTTSQEKHKIILVP